MLDYLQLGCRTATVKLACLSGCLNFAKSNVLPDCPDSRDALLHYLGGGAGRLWAKSTHAVSRRIPFQAGIIAHCVDALFLEAKLTCAVAPQADNNVCVLGQHISTPVQEVAVDPYISFWATPETYVVG